jgi:hypothetical protein
MTEAPSSVEEVQEEEYELTPEESEMFKILVHVGRLTDTIKVFGHDIVISTISVDEDLQVGLLLKEYDGTAAFQRAYRTLVAAAAVRSIDGQPLITPLALSELDSSTKVKPKFEKMKEYFPPVIDEIYNGIMNLEKKIAPVLMKLGKISA